MSNIEQIAELAGVHWPITGRSLTYDEYCNMMKIVVPHGPDEDCSCKGCGSCEGHVYGCTCDIDWEMVREVRDLWYA